MNTFHKHTTTLILGSSEQKRNLRGSHETGIRFIRQDVSTFNQLQQLLIALPSSEGSLLLVL